MQLDNDYLEGFVNEMVANNVPCHIAFELMEKSAGGWGTALKVGAGVGAAGALSSGM